MQEFHIRTCCSIVDAVLLRAFHSQMCFHFYLVSSSHPRSGQTELLLGPCFASGAAGMQSMRRAGAGERERSVIAGAAWDPVFTENNHDLFMMGFLH